MSILALLVPAVFVCLLLVVPPVTGAAWDDPRATANPCANWQEDLRTRRRLTPDEQRIHGWPYLYDGVAKLAAPMSRPITLSPEFSGSWKASCVIFEVMFSERNGELTIEREAARAVYPPVRSDVIAQRQRSGAEVLRQIPFSHVIANKPAPGTAYLVAVPLWPAHPFYTNNPDLIAGPVVGDLWDLGYSDAERIGGGDGVDVYKVFEQRSPNGKDLRVTFVVVRNLREDEPIVQIREGPGPLRTEQRPEGPVVEIFERLIAPWLQKQAKSAPLSVRQIHAEVRHYARGLRVPYDPRNGEAGLGTVADHKTGQPVDHPLLVVYHSGNVVPGDGMVRWGHNLSQPRYANIGELKQLLAEAHLSKEERARRAREAQEKIEQAQAAHDRKLDAQQQEVRRSQDPGNPLASLGYPNAEFILQEGRARYYLSEATGTGFSGIMKSFMVVVLHDVGATDTIIQLEPVGKSTYRYLDSRIAYVSAKLLPPAVKRWPQMYRLEIHHHVSDMPLDDTAEFRRRGARGYGYKYDQPLFEEEYIFDKDRGAWRPFYEVGTYGSDSFEPRKYEYSLTIAEARALRAELAEAHRFAKLSPEQRRAELRAQRLKIQAERSPHYVYKSDRFWAMHPRFYIPQQVFDGNFSGFQINTQFPEHFIRFVHVYSAHCEDYVKRGTHLKRTIKTLDEYDNVLSERHIYVEERFVAKFREYERLVGFATAGEVVNIILNKQGDMAGAGAKLLSSTPAEFLNDLLSYTPIGPGNQAMDMLSKQLGVSYSWKQFFGAYQCISPTILQMRENMLRAANGQPSLQAAGLRVPNAAAETEPLVPPPGKATIFDACYDDHEYKDADFCMCMDTRTQKVMSQDELKKYSADFSLYYSEIVFPEKGGLQDPRWRLYDLLKQCSGS